MSDHKDRKNDDVRVAKRGQESSEIVDQSIASVSKDITGGAAKGAAKGAVKGAIAGAVEGATSEAKKAAVTAQDNVAARKKEERSE